MERKLSAQRQQNAIHARKPFGGLNSTIMGLTYKFQRAENFLQTLSSQEQKALEAICRRIQAAEEELFTAATNLMRRCMHRCGGICCRNIYLDAIIQQVDFIYLLTLHPELKEQVAKCLEKEDPLFTENCVFLENGVGPCLFPSAVRPSVCITTFCDREDPVKKEIRRVQRSFRELTWFLLLRPPRAVYRKLKRLCHIRPVST